MQCRDERGLSVIPPRTHYQPYLRGGTVSELERLQIDAYSCASCLSNRSCFRNCIRQASTDVANYRQ